MNATPVPIGVHTIAPTFCAVRYNTTPEETRVYYHHSLPVAVFSDSIIYIPAWKKNQVVKATTNLVNRFIDHEVARNIGNIVRMNWSDFLEKVITEYGVFQISEGFNFDPYRMPPEDSPLIKSPFV